MFDQAALSVVEFEATPLSELGERCLDLFPLNEHRRGLVSGGENGVLSGELTRGRVELGVGSSVDPGVPVDGELPRKGEHSGTSKARDECIDTSAD